MLKSSLILGIEPQKETADTLRANYNLASDSSINFMLFETNFGNKKYYVSLSGGHFIGNEPYFTLIGRAAFEALHKLPLGIQEPIWVHEIVKGKTPFDKKIKDILISHPANSKICFCGDLEKKLDGLIVPIFNPILKPIDYTGIL